jgi:hypothetical protein
VKVVVGMRSRRLATLGAFAVLAAVGCSTSASSGGNPPGAPSAVGTGASLRHPLTPEQVAAELVAGARVPPAATEVDSAPTRTLQTAPSTPAASGRIERMRWWRVDRPINEVYAEIARRQSPDLAYDSSSDTNGPSLADQVKSASYTFHHVPLSVNSASFSISVAPLTETTSAIGAYAVVIKQPPRPVSENVPVTVDEVTIETAVGPTVDYASPGPALPAAVTVADARAQQIVSDFNELRTRPQSVGSCPMALRTHSATFAYDGHTLIATLGICNAVTVTLDGSRLPTLDATPMFTHDIGGVLRHQPVTTNRRLPGRH